MKRTFYLLLPVLLLISACASVPVNSDYSSNTDFRKYTSYAWIPSSDSAMMSQKYNPSALRANIIKAVNEEMQARGFQLDTTNPQLLLVLHTMFETTTETVREPVYATYPYYYPGFYTGPVYDYYWPGYPTVSEIVGYDIETIQYQEGSIVIDMIDRNTNNIIWRGWTENALKSEVAEDVFDIVSRLFDEKFPVRENVYSAK